MAGTSSAQDLTGWPRAVAEWLRREVDLGNTLGIGWKYSQCPYPMCYKNLRPLDITSFDYLFENHSGY